MPSELREVHRRIMNADSFYGSLLESNSLVNSYFISKQGYLKKLSLYIKVCYLQGEGLQGFSLLTFDNSRVREDSMMIAATPAGKIVEVSRKVDQIF